METQDIKFFSNYPFTLYCLTRTYRKTWDRGRLVANRHRGIMNYEAGINMDACFARVIY